MTRLDTYVIVRDVSTREIPTEVYERSLGERVRWARKTAGLSHDRLVERLGRSNRGHLIKIEQGLHVPREDLRDELADALGVPRELFADNPREAAQLGDPFRGSDGAASPRGSDERGSGVRGEDEVAA